MDRIIICRCEEVALDTIVETVKQFNCSAREVKLRTRAGMGYCCGRTCRMAIDAIIQEVSGNKIAHTPSLKMQTPVRAVSLATLGRFKTDE